MDTFRGLESVRCFLPVLRFVQVDEAATELVVRIDFRSRGLTIAHPAEAGFGVAGRP